MHASPPPAPWAAYRRLWPYLRPYLPRLPAVMLVSLLATALSLAQPYISKLMIDGALMRHDMGVLWRVAGLMLGATVGSYVLNIAASWLHVSLSAAMLFDIRVAVLSHLQRLSPRFFGRFRLGDLMSRLNSDVSDIQRVAGDTLLAALANLLFLAGSIALMLWLDWRLFLVGVVLVPLAVGAFLRAQKRLTELSRQMREAGADIGSMLVDTIMGMRTVVALGAQARERERFAGANASFVRAMLRMQVTSFLSGAVPGTLLSASTAGAMLWGGYEITAGRMTIGTLVAFLAYQQRLFAPIQGLLGLSATLAQTRVALARIFELMDTPPEVEEAACPLPLPAGPCSIRFDHVRLSHGRAPVLHDADFTIPAGSFCAILGPSGAGKSTMADLMVRMIDPDGGRVMLGERDLREVVLDDLRRAVLLVEQTPFLFNATLYANIAFGLADPGRDAVIAAARDAGLEALLARLPMGLDTPVGERGLALSAGERQRVALARALLRRPDALILDEPTAALDGDTEALIAASLRRALPHATLIVITHKPALAAMADRVITLKDGITTYG
ncbi:ABC transporter ATP-binding protein [Novosphingobium humi]|uniref:ABC transporter ATP-binding protein n=1 Tax=Novosphingobium humi TaxID=2282397 RepID=UPI0025AFBDE6|nr:ABC transporter ATP-binding protein [Novosphingobium humi]WJS98501.1 ABC transporter ATP-binding protein/permease [Novosphingobium humi]